MVGRVIHKVLCGSLLRSFMNEKEMPCKFVYRLGGIGLVVPFNIFL